MATQDKNTDLVPFSSYAIATMESSAVELMRENVGAGGVSVFDLDRVRIPAGGGITWEVPSLEGPEAVKTIDGIIVHWREPRAYWRESFSTTGGGTPPDCSSDDGLFGVGDPGGACARCPNAVFGSAVDDKGEAAKGQACKQMRLLFMLRQGDLLPLAMFLPPTSITPLRQYFMRLTSKGRPYYSVVTRLALDQKTSGGNIKYSVARPEVAALLDAVDVEKVKTYGASIRDTLDAVVVTDEDRESTLRGEGAADDAA